jgi:hypothetical protein
VVYDAGLDPSRTLKRLADVGAIAWAVDLPLPSKGDDLTDWFVEYGRSAGELRDVCNAAWRCSRRSKSA